MNKISLIIIIILCGYVAQAQQITFGIKYTGLAIHPKKKPSNSGIYKLKLDKKGRFVANGGITISCQMRLWNFLGVGVSQTIMPYDCGGLWSGATQLGAAFMGNFTQKHSINGIVGPMVFYRKNWNTLPNYENDHFYKTTANGKIQYLKIWYGGQLEYIYWHKPNTGICVNILPGFPELIEISGGLSVRK